MPPTSPAGSGHQLRASDYFGPGAQPGMSYLNHYVIRAAAAGKTVRLPLGGPDVPRVDLPRRHRLARRRARRRRALVGPALARARRLGAHHPEVAAEAAELAGRPADRADAGGRHGSRRACCHDCLLDETRHQFEAPFVVDSRVTEATFALAPTAWATALAETVAAYADRASVTEA